MAFKGTAEINILEDFSFSFKVMQEKIKIQKFTPFFLSETTLKEFEEEFLDAMQDELLLAINQKFGTNGVSMQLGSDLNTLHTERKVTMSKDYIKVVAKKEVSADDNKRALSHYSTYLPQKEAQVLRNYPIAWVVDRNHVVKKFVQTEPLETEIAESCSGKSCRETQGAVVEKRDEL